MSKFSAIVQLVANSNKRRYEVIFLADLVRDAANRRVFILFEAHYLKSLRELVTLSLEKLVLYPRVILRCDELSQ